MHYSKVLHVTFSKLQLPSVITQYFFFYLFFLTFDFYKCQKYHEQCTKHFDEKFVFQLPFYIYINVGIHKGKHLQVFYPKINLFQGSFHPLSFCIVYSVT